MSHFFLLHTKHSLALPCLLVRRFDRLLLRSVVSKSSRQNNGIYFFKLIATIWLCIGYQEHSAPMKATTESIFCDHSSIEFYVKYIHIERFRKRNEFSNFLLEKHPFHIISFHQRNLKRASLSRWVWERIEFYKIIKLNYLSSSTHTEKAFMAMEVPVYFFESVFVEMAWSMEHKH